MGIGSSGEKEAAELQEEKAEEVKKAELERIQALKRAQGGGGVGVFAGNDSTLG